VRPAILVVLAVLACDPATKPTTPAPTPTVTPPAAADAVSDLKSDEDARIFQTVARRDGDAWVVPLHAWVYEPEDGAIVRGAALDALLMALELPAEAESNDIFRARAKAFLYDNESAKHLVVRLGGAAYTLPGSGANGHSEATLRVPADGLAPGWTAAAVVPRAGDPRTFSGDVLLLADTGVSVISDVDDTIKISEVRDKQKLLENTFLKPFVAVPGMAAAYARWAGQGAAFHYVSASPWQLFDPLTGFIAEAAYPRGSMHMKLFRWKDGTFFSLFQSPIEYKQPILSGLIAQFPQRKFVLIGDSGEKDPEVYAAVYRVHPQQVVGIYIRDVSDEPRDAPRYQTAFTGIPADRWTIFTDPATLPAAL
jgi:hypothetical protein